MSKSISKPGWSWVSVVGIALLVLASYAMVHSKSILISPGWDDLDAKASKWLMLICSYLLFGIATLIGVIMMAKYGFRCALANALQVAIGLALGANVLFYVYWPTTDILVSSVAGNDMKRTRFCLDWGVDVDQRVTYSVDHLYSTPLSVAVEQENLAMVDLLLSFGADPKFDGRRQRLFALTRSWEIRDRLLAAGENIDSEWHGRSFLEHAITFSRQPNMNQPDTELCWKEVQEFLSRGATITDDVRTAALMDLELARRIENHLVAKGHRDSEPRWVLFRALILGQKEIALHLLNTEPKLSEFPKSSDLQLAVRCGDSAVLHEWIPRIEASHRYRTGFLVKILEQAANTAGDLGNQNIVDLLAASAARIKVSPQTPSN